MLGALKAIEFFDAALAVNANHLDALFGKCRSYVTLSAWELAVYWCKR